MDLRAGPKFSSKRRLRRPQRYGFADAPADIWEPDAENPLYLLGTTHDRATEAS